MGAHRVYNREKSYYGTALIYAIRRAVLVLRQTAAREDSQSSKGPWVALKPSQFTGPFSFRRRDQKKRGGLEQPGRAGEVKKFAAGLDLAMVGVIIS